MTLNMRFTSETHAKYVGSEPRDLNQPRDTAKLKKYELQNKEVVSFIAYYKYKQIVGIVFLGKFDDTICFCCSGSSRDLPGFQHEISLTPRIMK